jgi:hypothetical protein
VRLFDLLCGCSLYAMRYRPAARRARARAHRPIYSLATIAWSAVFLAQPLPLLLTHMSTPPNRTGGLGEMTVGALRQRAADVGVPAEQIEGARDGDDPN